MKLGGYLKREAAEIQRLSGDDGFTVIRLLLPERLCLLVAQRKLDLLLQSIVDKHPAIQEIVLQPVERILSVAEMQEILDEEKLLMDEVLKDTRQMEALASAANDEASP